MPATYPEISTQVATGPTALHAEVARDLFKQCYSHFVFSLILCVEIDIEGTNAYVFDS